MFKQLLILLFACLAMVALAGESTEAAGIPGMDMVDELTDGALKSMPLIGDIV